jgi:hypothetical protein
MKLFYCRGKSKIIMIEIVRGINRWQGVYSICGMMKKITHSS